MTPEQWMTNEMRKIEQARIGGMRLSGIARPMPSIEGLYARMTIDTDQARRDAWLRSVKASAQAVRDFAAVEIDAFRDFVEYYSSPSTK